MLPRSLPCRLDTQDLARRILRAPPGGMARFVCHTTLLHLPQRRADLHRAVGHGRIDIGVLGAHIAQNVPGLCAAAGPNLDDAERLGACVGAQDAACHCLAPVWGEQLAGSEPRYLCTSPA